MTLLDICLLILIAFAMWAANTYIPMQKALRIIVNGVVVLLVLLWVLKKHGWMPDMKRVLVGKKA